MSLLQTFETLVGMCINEEAENIVVPHSTLTEHLEHDIPSDPLTAYDDSTRIISK